MMSTLARRLPQVLGLTLVWVALWGVLSVKIVVGGVLVAVAVAVLFPMPLLDRIPFRPVPLLKVIGYVLVDLARSGFAVAWVTLRDGPRARAGIVGVPLLTRSGRVIMVVAGALALSPGSYVLQIDRRRGVVYVYALGLTAPSDADRVREQVLTLQRSVVEAFGHADEVALCRGHVTEGPS